jgi:hypothetical protein
MSERFGLDLVHAFAAQPPQRADFGKVQGRRWVAQMPTGTLAVNHFIAHSVECHYAGPMKSLARAYASDDQVVPGLLLAFGPFGVAVSLAVCSFENELLLGLLLSAG